MYRQTSYTPDKIYDREISDQKTIELLVQLHLLRQAGEQIEVHTNASQENGWAWDNITVKRHGSRGEITTVFQRLDK